MDARELLLEERDQARVRIAALRADHAGVVDASRDSNADDEHDPEGQTIAFERAQTGALLRQAEQHLAEVEAALVRLDQGTYGVCESCGLGVPPQRLAARPTARLCVACASRAGGRGTGRP